MAPQALTTLRDFEQLLRDVNQRFNLISRGQEGAIWKHHILHCLTIAVRGVPAQCRVVDWGTGGGLPAVPLSIVWPDTPIVAVDSNAKKTRAVTLFARRLGLENCMAVHARAERIQANELGGDNWSAGDVGASGWPASETEARVVEAAVATMRRAAPLLSVSRATAPLVTLWSWHERALRVLLSMAAPGSGSEAASKKGSDAPDSNEDDAVWAPGLVCLKGGDLGAELGAFAWEYPRALVRTYDVRDYLDDPWFDGKKLLHITDSHGT